PLAVCWEAGLSLALLVAAALALVGAAHGARWAARAHAARSLLHQMGLTDAEIHALENVSASSSDELVPALSAHRKLAARVAAVQAALDLIEGGEPDGGGVAPSSAGA